MIHLKSRLWLEDRWRYEIFRSITPTASKSIHILKHHTSYSMSMSSLCLLQQKIPFNNSDCFPKPGSHHSPSITVCSESTCWKLCYPQCWWLFNLSWTPPAVEKCSDKSCLPLSLLELLAFNMTFIFIASMVVLIEVRLLRFTCFS